MQCHDPDHRLRRVEPVRRSVGRRVPFGQIPAPQPGQLVGWADGGLVKTSAAWLIQHAGFGRGFGDGSAGLSTKHALALTNRGGATASDLVALARTVRDGVAERFGVVLVPEVNLVGLSL